MPFISEVGRVCCFICWILGLFLLLIGIPIYFKIGSEACNLDFPFGCTRYNRLPGIVIGYEIFHINNEDVGLEHAGSITLQLQDQKNHQKCELLTRKFSHDDKATEYVQANWALNTTKFVLQEKADVGTCITVSYGQKSWSDSLYTLYLGFVLCCCGTALLILVGLLDVVSDWYSRFMPGSTGVRRDQPVQEMQFRRVEMTDRGAVEDTEDTEDTNRV